MVTFKEVRDITAKIYTSDTHLCKTRDVGIQIIIK